MSSSRSSGALAHIPNACRSSAIRSGRREPAVPAQQLLNSADLQNLRGLVLDDPVRTLQVLPGVAATDDFTAEFAVRGANFAHIGLAIDGVSSPFLSHTVQGADETGSIGMINSDILENVALFNGSYPQRFGNRTGAQVEMTLREGSRDRAHGRLALSGSSASVVGEGPLGRRGAWLLSARKSYLDLLIKQISDQDNFAFGFSDIAGKLTWDLTAKQKLAVSAVVGRSRLSASQLHVGVNNPLVARNDAFLAVAGWHYAPGPRLLLTQRVSVTGSRYYGRSLARVVLDEGKSLTAGWRTDLQLRADLTMVARRRRECVAQPRRDRVAAHRRPAGAGTPSPGRGARLDIGRRVHGGALVRTARVAGGRRRAR